MSILIVAGTNRPGSNARKLADIVAGVYARLSVAAEVYSLVELPPETFLPESYANKPAGVMAMQQKVLAASGLHLIVPEYNGSFPGVLKYWIDMLKFPESFEQKPVAFIGEAAGQWGALRAVEQLQHIFGYRNAHIYPRRIFIPAVHTKFDDAGRLNDSTIIKMIDEQVAGFAKFVAAVGSR